MTEKKVAWTACLTSGLFIFYVFLQLGLLNSTGAEIIKLFKLNYFTLGILSAAFFYSNLLFLIPAGLLLDYIYFRYLILLAVALVVASSLFFITPINIEFLITGRIIAGIGSAFSFLGCMKVIHHFLPVQNRGLATGLIATLAALGGLCAQAPTLYLIQMLGWKITMIINSTLGIIVFIIIYLMLHDKNYYLTLSYRCFSLSFFEKIKKSFFTKQHWACGIFSGLIVQPVFLLGDLWGILYLKNVHFLLERQASLITSMIFFGGILGTPAIGWLSDKLNNRITPMIIFSGLTFLILLFIYYSKQTSVTHLIILFFLLGFTTSAQALGYVIVSESNSSETTTLSSCIISICALSGAGFFEAIFGKITDSYNFHSAFLLIITITLLSFFSVFFIKKSNAFHNK